MPFSLDMATFGRDRFHACKCKRVRTPGLGVVPPSPLPIPTQAPAADCKRNVQSFVVLIPQGAVVSKVVFYVGTRVVYTDTAAPYFVTFVPRRGRWRLVPPEHAVPVRFPMRASAVTYFRLRRGKPQAWRVAGKWAACPKR